MKSCVYCKHAEWARTKGGKLHPSGDGKCTHPKGYETPKIPAAFYFVGGWSKPSGGYINRRKELKDDCLFFQREGA